MRIKVIGLSQTAMVQERGACSCTELMLGPDSSRCEPWVVAEVVEANTWHRLA